MVIFILITSKIQLPQAAIVQDLCRIFHNSLDISDLLGINSKVWKTKPREINEVSCWTPLVYLNSQAIRVNILQETESFHLLSKSINCGVSYV